MLAIFGHGQAGWHGAAAGAVTAGWHVLLQSFMRALEIVDLAPSIESALHVAQTGEAPKGIDNTGDPIMNGVWSFLHTPCVSVNGGFGPNGLPLGMQVVGRLDDDARTLACAHWVHRRLGR